MSWNPNPTIGTASWSGSPSIATKNQLLSTSSGLYEDLKDFNFSTISVSTLNVPLWISTPVLYVSDIQGTTIDISGIIFDASGLLYAPLLSSSVGNFNVINISTLKFEFNPQFTGKITFDLGLGQAIGGFLAGLGALVGGAFIGVGTGLGLIIQGAEQGIATIVAGRPQNFITNNSYETINFTSQLQVSTLGNAYPLYSSIFRTVSTNFTDQEPGKEIFTSSFFLPGQICIRAASDPFNLISGDPNLNTSTIQSFGQWVPLEGLEPENIVANSVTANILSSGVAYIDVLDAQVVEANGFLASNTIQVGQNNFPGNLIFPYESYAEYQTTALGNTAKQFGSLNYWWYQSDQDFAFSRVGDVNTTPINAQLSLGSNGFESYLQVSSIFSRGNIQANTGFFSTLTVESLFVVSSLSTLFTQSNVTTISTAIVDATEIFAREGTFSTVTLSSISPFTVKNVLGNPTGPFDITKNDLVVSTSYNQISSLTQNILSYSLNTTINNQTTWDLPERFNIQPANVGIWASTIAYRGATAGNPVTLQLSYSSNWTAGPVTGGTFDLKVDMTQQPFYLYVSESSNAQNTQISSLLTLNPTPGLLNTYRFTLQSNGWWNYATAGAPYITSNNNTFQIYQDINDTWIDGTDRLHLKAGNIFLDGVANFADVGLFQASNIYTSNLDVTNIFAGTEIVSTINVQTLNASSITANPNTGGIDTYFYKPSTLSFNDPPTSVTPTQTTFITQSPDFIPTFTLIPPFMGSNSFTSYNQTSWNNSIWNNTTAFSLGPPFVYLGDVQTTLGSYSAKFWINNNAVTPSYALSIYVITPTGSNLLGNIPGGNYALIQTSNGVTWTLNSNVSNPQGTVGGNFSNIITTTQAVSLTQQNHTQNFQLNAPNTTFLTGSLNLYADQIRVNSRRYGSLESAGVVSFPIGIENTVYIDSNIAWSQVPPASGLWQSDATNALLNINQTIFYDANSWIVQIIPSRFRTNSYPIYSWDVQPTILSVGGGGFCWGYNRYIQIAAGPSGPGIGTTNNWNWVIAFPKNYCTYT